MTARERGSERVKGDAALRRYLAGNVPEHAEWTASGRASGRAAAAQAAADQRPPRTLRSLKALTADGWRQDVTEMK